MLVLLVRVLPIGIPCLTKESTEREWRKLCGRPRCSGPTGVAGRVGTTSGDWLAGVVDLAVENEESEVRDTEERRVKVEGFRSGVS